LRQLLLRARAADAEARSRNRNGGNKGVALRADVGDESEVEQLFATATRRSAAIDLLVNNAGIEKQIALVDMRLEDWDAVLRTNLTAPFSVCARRRS